MAAELNVTLFDENNHSQHTYRQIYVFIQSFNNLQPLGGVLMRLYTGYTLGLTVRQTVGQTDRRTDRPNNVHSDLFKVNLSVPVFDYQSLGGVSEVVEVSHCWSIHVLALERNRKSTASPGSTQPHSR